MFFANSFAQNPVARILNTENGLPSNTVYNMLQDSFGYIWIAHDKGLSRYDGASFTNYVASAQQGKSVSNLMENNGKIWCQDFSGNFYYTEGNQLKKETAISLKNYFRPAAFTNNNTLVIVNEDSVRTLNNNTKKTTNYKLGKTIEPATYSNNNEILLLSDRILYSFNGSSFKKLMKLNYSSKNYFFIIKTKSSYYGVIREKSSTIYKINENYATPLPIIKTDLQVNNVSYTNNEIWICTTSGAYCFDKEMNPKFANNCFYSDKSISNIIVDKEGNYWFSTINNGILVVNDITNKLYKYGNESIATLSSYKNNELLAATTTNLIFSFNKQTNNIQTLFTNNTKGEAINLFYDTMYQTIISSASNLSYYNNNKLIYTNLIASKNIAIISEDAYAVAYSGGIAVMPRNPQLKLKKNWYLKYTDTAFGLQTLITGTRGRAVFYDKINKIIYTGSASGLHYFNEEEKNEIKINKKSIYASCFAMINQSLYAGTFTDGLVKITNKKASVLNLINNKLAVSIYKVFSYNNELWIICDDGVQKLNVETNEVTNYTKADGLPKGEIKDLQIDENFLYIATTDGLVVINKNKSTQNNVPPTILLQKLIVNDNVIDYNDNLKFSAADNNIQILLSLISFKQNQLALVKYKINNSDWKFLQPGTRLLQLASLQSGSYIIEIGAQNEDGVENTKNLIIKFTIKAPFYKTIWFWLLIASVLITGVYAYFALKLKSEQKSKALVQQKMELERELHQSMLSSIKSQMNPHFLFNALNTIQSYIYTNEKENASLYLGKFSELTRMILDMSNKESVPLADEIKALELYLELEQLRFENKLIYTFSIDTNLSTETIFIPTMLIQPYVENAIKHGLMHIKKQWNLQIGFKLNKVGLMVTIDDNGIGREASAVLNVNKNKQHKSFATNANEKRLAILNKNFATNINVQFIDKKDNEGNAIGTTVILNIPTVV